MATIYNKGADAQNVNVVNDTYDAIDKIFRSDITVAEGRNTLDGFYKGEVLNGRLLEEVFVEMATPYTFTKDDTQYVFKGNDAGIHFVYYGDWTYEQSNKELFIYKIRELLDAGKSPDDIASAVVASLRNGDNFKIYNDMKGLLLDAKATMNAWKVPSVSTEEELLLQIRNIISHFEFTNDDYCDYAHRTLKDNIRVIISAELINRIDVVKLANTLNIDRAEIDTLFWKIDTTDNVVYVVDKNALGYFTKNTRGYSKFLEELRKIIYYYDNDKMYYASSLFKATYLTFNENALNFEMEAETNEVLGANPNTLQKDISIVGNNITGELLYKEGYTGYSQSAELQEGNFFAFKIVPTDITATIKLKLLGGVGPEVTMDSDLNAVVRITSTTQKIRVIMTKGNSSVVKVYNLTGLVLDAKEE